MEIISIKRSKKENESGVKVYGKVLGDSGNVYDFAYIRRSTFRGFLCSCENFILSKFAKHQTCKHIQFVRSQVGRYAATVDPTRPLKEATGSQTNNLAV